MIVATIGRKKEVDLLLKSISKISYSLADIEVIIVDQNKNNILEDIILKYKYFYSIKHIKSEEKGLAKNRNIGIKFSTGEVICFPDDDCQFFPDTLKNVIFEFEKNKKLDVIMGKIIDENGNDCIRKWSSKRQKITKSNFYLKNSSITLFKRKKDNEFFEYDESFGVGSKYGSCEDADFLYRLLRLKYQIEYNPSIVLFHPSFKGKIKKEKAYEYGVGFGAFCQKNLDRFIFKLYIMSNLWFVLRIILNILKLNLIEAKILYFGFLGRLYGFKIYRKSFQRENT